ncbi:hypothetical protein WICPIJ_009902 [Wickerhamomyces pijperi]|uniref:Uncharacterized protein n=1 Tax=Wickerhamomyces pijperi TaxID=599730 RepID=A0A9P8PK85_WICPI|nr:hypothetical protein WICPIJ_009902 [Wickerhamomyces pijperi]
MLVHDIHWLVTSQLDDFALLVKVLHDRVTGLNEGSESLLDTLDVVVGSSGGLTSLQESFKHNLFRTFEENGECRSGDFGLEDLRLVHLTREPVNEESVLAFGNGLLHSLFQQRNCHFLWNNVTFSDVLGNQFTVLGPFTLLLGSKQVPG